MRNARQPLQKGLLARRPAERASSRSRKGKLPGRAAWHRNDAKPMFVGKTKDVYPKPDGKYTFDKLSSVFITGNATRDDAPNHIRVQKHVPREIAETWRWMCPAGVYEIPEDAPEHGRRRRDRQLHQLRAVRRDHRQGRAPDDARGRRRAALPDHLSSGARRGVQAGARRRNLRAPWCVTEVVMRIEHRAPRSGAAPLDAALAGMRLRCCPRLASRRPALRVRSRALAPRRSAPQARASASATLEQCVTAPNQTERSATFAGEMTAVPGTARMVMRIEVLERDARAKRPSTPSRCPGLGVWRGPSPGVKTYKYLKQVTNLAAPAVLPRRGPLPLGGREGRTIKTLELRTPRCEQPLARARERDLTRAGAHERRRPRAGAVATGRRARAAARMQLTMKAEDPPQLRAGARALHVRQRVHDARHARRAARRGLLQLPPVLHGPAEADGHGRPRRALPAPRRQGPPARPSPVSQVAAWPSAWPPTGRRSACPRRRAAVSAPVRDREGVRAAAPAADAGRVRRRRRARRAEAARDAPLGGQAVLEGVMMRGVSNWAVAVRKPSAEQLQRGRASRPRRPRSARSR